MSFAFKPEEKWNAGGGMLQKGRHVTEVLEITAGDLTSSGNYPMVKVQVGNDDGTIYDNIVISSTATFGKFTALVLACGIPEEEYPQPGVDFDADTGRVSQQYADKLVGRRCGTVVGESPDNRETIKIDGEIKPNPYRGKPRPEVSGYVLPSTITDDMPADTRGLPAAQAPSASRPAGEQTSKIPF